ncbi:MAG: phosphatidylcholine/phosphatidylserine synthase [Hyphomicrobiaceae bacterium]
MRAGAARRLSGYAVHAFTASGSVCALLAILAILDNRFEQAFGWLLIALVIDAVDGTLARAVSVEVTLPRISGERLDLVVDYITYVFVPVLALLRGGFLSGTIGLCVGALILLSSLFHFSDKRSKADDHCFVGFPAVWNLVAFCVFAWGLPTWAAAGMCLVLSALTFVPLHWVHPMRVRRFFAANISMAAVGVGVCLWVLVTGFPGGWLARALLAGSAAYFTALALAWKIIARPSDSRGSIR